MNCIFNHHIIGWSKISSNQFKNKPLFIFYFFVGSLVDDRKFSALKLLFMGSQCQF